MENLYNINGLIFWSEEEIRLRNMFESFFLNSIRLNLKTQNSAFDFFKFEAPLLTPDHLINPNYTNEDVWMQAKETQDHQKEQGLTLRPETTMGSYAYAKHLLNAHNERKVRPPLVVYQHGKSFRREQDQVVGNMRLKEFYQLEFQIIYSPATKNDYSVSLIPTVKKAISEMIGPCRLEDSDRLPSYAEWTKDVICEWTNMEVCSISKRTDFEGMSVLEVAIGTDRCVYNFNHKKPIL